MTKHSPSPEFDDQDWQDIQWFSRYVVPFLVLLAVAHAYGAALGLHGVLAIVAGLMPAYLTGKVLRWLYQRVYVPVAALWTFWRGL